MAIVETQILADDREGEVTKDGKRVWSERWYVRTDDGKQGPKSVLFSGLVPQTGQWYQRGRDLDTQARVSRVRCSPAAPPHAWHVDVEYETPDVDEPQEQPPDNQAPWEREPQVSIRFEQVEVPLTGKHHTSVRRLESDLRGLVNSAQEPFIPPPTILEARLVITVERAEQTLNLQEVTNYQNSVNVVAWANFPAETLRLTISNSQEAFYENKRYWRKSYELAYKPDTWALSLLDYGTRTMAGVDPSYGYTQPESNFGNPVEVTLLNGAGGTATTPTYLTFYPYKARNFRGLRLPESVILDRAN